MISLDKFNSFILTNSKSLSCNFNIVRGINYITSDDNYAIYPYSWEEIGDYHVDIFYRD